MPQRHDRIQPDGLSFFLDIPAPYVYLLPSQALALSTFRSQFRLSIAPRFPGSPRLGWAVCEVSEQKRKGLFRFRIGDYPQLAAESFNLRKQRSKAK
jgi:hypothetical protein